MEAGVVTGSGEEGFEMKRCSDTLFHFNFLPLLFLTWLR